MTGLARRVLREKRAVILPLAVVLALNLLIGVLVVLPMSERVGRRKRVRPAPSRNWGPHSASSRPPPRRLATSRGPKLT